MDRNLLALLAIALLGLTCLLGGLVEVMAEGDTNKIASTESDSSDDSSSDDSDQSGDDSDESSDVSDAQGGDVDDDPKE